jgi:hypothetical protein
MVIGLLLFFVFVSVSRIFPIFPYFHFLFRPFLFVSFVFLGGMGGQRVSQSIPVVGVFFCCLPSSFQPDHCPNLDVGEHVFFPAGVC